eukprot:2290536-Pleurochrysis_carterae.AAC.5
MAARRICYCSAEIAALLIVAAASTWSKLLNFCRSATGATNTAPKRTLPSHTTRVRSKRTTYTVSTDSSRPRLRQCNSSLTGHSALRPQSSTYVAFEPCFYRFPGSLGKRQAQICAWATAVSDLVHARVRALARARACRRRLCCASTSTSPPTATSDCSRQRYLDSPL